VITCEEVFEFLPLPDGHTISDDACIVIGRAGTGGFVNSDIRLRDKLHEKAGKYDLRGKPYAVVVGVHDPMCEITDVRDALFGSLAVVVATGQDVRKGDGFFGVWSLSEFDGKHPQVSCVYAVEDWWPGGPYLPRVTRFDNPFAETSFPLEGLPLDAHWAVVDKGPKHVRLEWVIRPGPLMPSRP
jgi:hypothetical protein